MNKDIILEVRDLKKHFPIYQGVFRRQVGAVRAVDGISFSVYRGETLGLVGESGCGKSTAGRTILKLYESTDGEIYFEGENITEKSESEMREMRPNMQMIFQDPQACLNPRMTVGSIIDEPLREHSNKSSQERQDRVNELLSLVGLNPSHSNRYPHEFSGGQRQRIGIARALALQPQFIMCDEPIAALDVSIQAQVVNLLEDLQKEFGLTYLFISHDLSMIRYFADRVAVMYLGKIVELAGSDELYEMPLHPYTQALLSAVPVPDPELDEKRQRVILEGDVPSPANPPSGCRFHTRCPIANNDTCKTIDPEFRELVPGHFVACHLADQFVKGSAS